MPKKTNPGTITTGAGSAPEEESNYTLNNSGQIVADPNAKHDHGKPGLNVHTESVIDAHPASAITVGGKPASFFAHSVEGALDELAGALPPRPPSLGNWRTFMGFSGIPDWGKLKLRDASLQFNDASVFSSTAAFPSETYPYYWYPVVPTHLTRNFNPLGYAYLASTDLGPFTPGGLTDPAMQNLLEYKNSVSLDSSLADTFLYQEYNALDLSLNVNNKVIPTEVSGTQSVQRWSAGGNDPATDPMFNVEKAGYPGGGIGNTYEGAYTQPVASPMWGAADNVASTMRVVKTDPNKTELDVTVSGTLFPADRGVLALIHWPENGVKADFVALPLGTKVQAALLLGQGLSEQANSCECDGGPGGIFLPGMDNAGNHDPFMWPGQAAGQANLEEIYSGRAQCVSLPKTQGSTLSPGATYIYTPLSPYYNFDGKVSTTSPIMATTAGPAPTSTAINVVGHDYLQYDVVTIVGAAQVPDGNYIIVTITDPDHFDIWHPHGGNVGGAQGTVQRIVGCSKQEYPSQGADAFPGQVRLGTREAAITGVTPIAHGIPIFAAYAKARGGGDNTNFINYRLPYLSDYAQTPQGLKWTPVSERLRYNRLPLGPSSVMGGVIPASYNYGNYGNFGEDHYPYQIARYRHTFQITQRGQGTQLGSYMLVHFKTEQSFEELARDGVWPTDDKIYSANISNVPEVNAGAQGIQNYVNIVSPDPQGYDEKTLYRFPAKGYHALRADLYDDALTSGLTVTASSLTYGSNIANHVMWVSGVQYFLPFDPTQHATWNDPANVNLSINPITVVAAGFFGDNANQVRSSYRTSPPRNGTWGNGDSTDFVGVFITTHGLKYSDQPPSGDLTNADALIANGNGWNGLNGVLPNKRRIEYPINTLGGGGNWMPGAGPGPEFNSSVTASSSDVFSYGDAQDPSFSTDVVLRVAFRRPIEHGIVGQPHYIFPLIPTDNSTMMVHTSCMPNQGPVPASAVDPEFGNHCLNKPGAGVTPNKAITSVETAAKDHSERFLDEVYRYSAKWKTAVAGPGITGNYLANLEGPGLPFVTGPIEVPVRAGTTNNHAATAALVWEDASWVQENGHGSSLGFGSQLNELQVAGMPDRNPPLTEGNDQPYPSAGRLMVPKVNYSATNALGGPYRPAITSGDISTVQRDYSAIPAAVSASGAEMTYVRAFDANFSRSSTNNTSPVSSGSVVAEGQPFVYLKIWGVTPADFEYSAGWRYGNKHMAILVKVPGITTWMDIGRNDGSGPAKQDPAQDGAGCRVVGPQTWTGIGTPYNEPYQDAGVKQLHNCGVVCSQVKINVGPSVNLFKTNDPNSGLTNDGEAPILVKIVMRYDAAASLDTLKYDFAHKYFNGAFGGTDDPNAETRTMRGIVGIELIRPDNA